jgi:hypothetical protein
MLIGRASPRSARHSGLNHLIDLRDSVDPEDKNPVNEDEAADLNGAFGHRWKIPEISPDPSSRTPPEASEFWLFSSEQALVRAFSRFHRIDSYQS